MGVCDLGVTFDLSSVRIFSTAILERYIFCDKDRLITETDYYMYFDITVSSPLAAMLQLINFTTS